MKATKLMVLFSTALATASMAFAADQAKAPQETQSQPVKKTNPQPSQPEKKSLLTGSYVKQKIRRSGQLTDGHSPVYVIDSKAIQNSGASDLRQLLVRQGMNR